MNGKPAVFLDRDGVLTVEKGYICPIEEVELFPYVAECIEEIHKRGYYAIVITNQSGVARGVFTERQLQRLHERMKKETGVDAIYYCPHLPGGKISQYALECSCRKPGIGLIEQACRDFAIDLSASYLAGDRETDIRTGICAGIRTVLVESGYDSKNLPEEIRPDYMIKDLRDLTRIL